MNSKVTDNKTKKNMCERLQTVAVDLSTLSVASGFIKFMLWHFSMKTMLDVEAVVNAFKAVWCKQEKFNNMLS